MSSSTQNQPSLQWLLTQISQNFELPSESYKVQYCQPQKFYEDYSLDNFDERLKTVSNSSKSLENNFTNALLQTPFIIWNTNSFGERTLHTVNCDKLGGESVDYNCKNNKGIIENGLYNKVSEKIRDSDNTINLLYPYTTLSQDSIVVPNRMVANEDLASNQKWPHIGGICESGNDKLWVQNNNDLSGAFGFKNMVHTPLKVPYEGSELLGCNKITKNEGDVILPRNGPELEDRFLQAPERLLNVKLPIDSENSRPSSEWSDSTSHGSYQPLKPKRRYPSHNHHPFNYCGNNKNYRYQNGWHFGENGFQKPNKGSFYGNKELHEGGNIPKVDSNGAAGCKSHTFPEHNGVFIDPVSGERFMHNQDSSYSDSSNSSSNGNRRYYNVRNWAPANSIEDIDFNCYYQNPRHKLSFGFHTANNDKNQAYYQIDSQSDLREYIGAIKRRLSDEAGVFASDSNLRWRIDHRVEARIIPPELLNGSLWDSLSQQAWNMFAKHQQLDSTFRAKIELKERIFRVIWNVLPICRLFVVGSSLSGFGANNSDVDMCLMVTPRDLDQRNDAQAVLRLLQRELNNCGFVEKMELITAKVPILKFRDALTGIDVDLNCNNSVGIRNTHLLNAYSQLDWRVRPLVLVVKLWAQYHNINNAKDMTISSYSFVLMVIHYLQYGRPCPLLPCLHKAFPDKFNSSSHVFRIPVMEKMPLFVSNNKDSLGQLLLGFLEYYTEKFLFLENTISVRMGGIIPTEQCKYVRTKKNDSRMWNYLCIEEPFDLTNTARSVYDEEIFKKVKRIFSESYNRLQKTRDLDSIFSPIR